MSFSAAEAASDFSLLQRLRQRDYPVGFLWRILNSCAALGPTRILFALCFTGLAVHATASAEIIIEPRVGFHGVYQLGKPFPLEIELNNSGRPAEGTLDVRVWKGGVTKGGAPFPINYRRELFLAAQSRKTVQFTVDPDFISRPMTITFASPSAKATREIDLRRNFSPAPILLLISENSALPPLSLAPSLQNRLVSIALTELAADPRALLGVSHLILYDQSLRDLSRAQLFALDVWLSAGGKMVILGSINFALYQEVSLGRFLPVRVAGTKRITFVPSVDKGERPVTIPDAWVQQSTVVNGNVLAESQGIPVIVEASRGRGKITYLALDVGRPPLSQWQGLPKLLQGLLAPAAIVEPPAQSEWNDAVFAQLFTSPSFVATYVPSGSLFVAMVVYLAGLGVIAWMWQRKRPSARTLLLALGGFVAMATIAGHSRFSRGGNIPDGVLLASTVLESGADGYVEAQANLALFSTQVRRYNLQFQRGWMELAPVSNRPREPQEQAVVRQDSAGSSRYQLPLREWDYRLFRLRFVDRFPVSTEFEIQGKSLLVKIDNQSVHDLTDCWLVLPGQRYSVGTISRGARWRKTFVLDEAKTSEKAPVQRADMLNFREVTFSDKTREILFHSSFFPRDRAAVWDSSGVFFGWVKNPEPRVYSDDANIQRQDFALYRARIPLASGDDE